MGCGFKTRQLSSGAWVLIVTLQRLPEWKPELGVWESRPGQCLGRRGRGSQHSLCWLVPFTSMVAFALGALWKWYTQWYSPESSALGLLILQRREEKSSEEAANSQSIQKENPGATRDPALQTVSLNATHLLLSRKKNRPLSIWKQ